MDSIIGVLIAALVMTFGIRTYADYQTDSNTKIMAATTATQWGQINTAAISYIQTNAAAIQATATSTTPVIITVAMLQSPAVNLLPASFTSTNQYQQTWQVEVLQPTAGNLQALVMTTGGTALLDKDAVRIATLVSAANGGVIGGIIPKNDTGIYSANMAYGTAGSWQISTTNYTGIAGGHLSALLTFNNGQLQSPFLYRNAVAGQPQLNTMNTPLVMASTQTTGAACATTGSIAQDGAGAVISCQGGTWQSQGSAYWKNPVTNFASLPACNAAAAWQTRVVQTPTTGTGPRAYTCNGATWLPLAVDDSGNMTVAGTMTVGQAQINTVVTEGTACSSNGLVARDSTGLLLSCQSGSWVSNVACSAFSGDLNAYEGNPGTSTCLNGVMTNAPTSDWYFVDVKRHINSANFYEVQTAHPMTGANVGTIYERVQQSATTGVGWGAWVPQGGKAYPQVATGYGGNLPAGGTWNWYASNGGWRAAGLSSGGTAPWGGNGVWWIAIRVS